MTPCTLCGKPAYLVLHRRRALNTCADCRDSDAPMLPAPAQTPATDSERVEQIRARWYEHHIDPTARDARVLLLTEVDVPWLLAEHTRLTALLAEQAATIERAEDLPDDLIVRAVVAGADAFGVLPDEIDDAHFDFARGVLRVVLAALGSQRTEGQG